MTMRHKLVDGGVHRAVAGGRVLKFADDALAPRRIRVVASNETVDRMQDVLEAAGAKLENFRRRPTVLAQHDATKPIARCSSIERKGSQIIATIDFPDPGVSALSDEYYNLVKADILGAVSVGFLPLEWEPIRNGGYRFTSWELLELSIVSTPANPDALVFERSIGRSAEQRAAIQRALARRERLAQPVCRAADDDNPYPGFVDTPAGRRRLIQELRERHGFRKRVDPRVVVADAAWRLQGAGL